MVAGRLRLPAELPNNGFDTDSLRSRVKPHALDGRIRSTENEPTGDS
jgi:hypothetical protein